MKKSKKNNKGFSLVELIVVVLILGILAVAVTPQIMTWIDKSHVAKDESYAGTASSAIEAVALDFIGQGRQDEIALSAKIVDGDIMCYPNDDLTGTVFAETDEDSFGYAVNAAFADGDKCSAPSQNSMDYFVVTITVNETLKTVSVETVATESN